MYLLMLEDRSLSGLMDHFVLASTTKNMWYELFSFRDDTYIKNS